MHIIKKWFCLLLLSSKIYISTSENESEEPTESDESESNESSEPANDDAREELQENNITVVENITEKSKMIEINNTIFNKILKSYLDIYQSAEEMNPKYSEDVSLILEQIYKYENKDPNIKRNISKDNEFYKKYEKSDVGKSFIEVLRTKLTNEELNETVYDEILNSHMNFYKDKLFPESSLGDSTKILSRRVKEKLEDGTITKIEYIQIINSHIRIYEKTLKDLKEHVKKIKKTIKVKKKKNTPSDMFRKRSSKYRGKHSRSLSNHHTPFYFVLFVQLFIYSLLN